MQTFRCTLHDCEFSVDDTIDQQKYPTRCPVCSWEEYWKLKEERDKLRRQNGTLLDAIQIKMDKLIIPVNNP